VTAIYDPSNPQYFDLKDLDKELNRVLEICHGCRLCYNLCPSFPALFGFIDQKDGLVQNLSQAETDEVIDKCYECKLCYVKCPYVPPHEWQLDFPRLMLRAKTLKRKYKQTPFIQRMGDTLMAKTDLIGKASLVAAPIVNKVVLKPGSVSRKIMQSVTGTAQNRLLPPYSKQRFSTWWLKRKGSQVKDSSYQVSLFTTCFVEYMNKDLGTSLVKVYEHNNIEITVPKGLRCCGAPSLHSGDVKGFLKVAKENVLRLAIDVKMGKKVVVAQPTCGYVLKFDYPLYLKSEASELVAKNTFDAAEFLVWLNKSQELKKDLSDLPQKVIYHLPCHLKAQNIGLKSKELLSLYGVDVQVVDKCSGIDGTWGYKKQNYDLSKKVIKPLKDFILTANSNDNKTICGDCHLANTAIYEETNYKVVSPFEILANAIKE
jgi:glycerol-3-phosphate dehydrogenase subunit C